MITGADFYTLNQNVIGAGGKSIEIDGFRIRYLQWLLRYFSGP